MSTEEHDAKVQRREKQLLERIRAQDAEIADLRRQLRRLKNQAANDEESEVPSGLSSEKQPVIKASRLRSAPGCEPPSVEGHGGVAYEGKLVIFGGTMAGAKAPCADTFQLNIPNGKWRALECNGDIPAPRSGHSCTLVGKSMVVFGGLTPEGISGTMYQLNLVSNQWSQVDPSTQKAGGVEPLKGHSAAVLHRKLFLFGGVSTEGRTNILHCFDIPKGEWLPLDEYNEQAHDEIARGGRSKRAAVSPPSHAEEDLHIPEGNNRSEEEDDLPAPRSGHSCCAYTRKSLLVVFGGRTGVDSCSNEVFTYCTTTKRWTQMYCGGDVIPPARCDHLALVTGDRMYVFGGYTVAGGVKSYHNDLFVLDLVGFTWYVLKVEGKKGIPAPGCSRAGCLFEDPDGQLCLLTHGGWVTTGEGGAFDSTGETWVLRLAAKGAADTKVIRAPAPPPPSKSLTRLTTSANARNGTLPPQLQQQQRPDTSSPRGQSRGGGVPIDESRPWISQTSKAQSAKLFGDPLSAPVPPPPEKAKRPKEDIEKIVERLSNMTVIENKKQRLMNRYLFNPHKEATPLSPEEQEESVNRLYYDQVEYREKRLADLVNNYYPPPAPRDHDEDEMYDMIERLSVPPAHRQPPQHQATAASSIAAAPTAKGGVEQQLPHGAFATPEQIKESVNRLYYQQQEHSRKKRQELEERYLAPRPTSKPSPRTAHEAHLN